MRNALRMNQHIEEQEEIRLYLLGLLPQERQQRLEERLLTESALYEELLIVEDELIDQYLAGQLTERERDGFEGRFMDSPERRQQLRFATAFKRYVADNTAALSAAAEPSREANREAENIEPSGGLLSWLRTRNPVLAFSLTAAALLLVCGIAFVAMRSLRPPAPRQVLTVMLTPHANTRGGGDIQQLPLPAGTDAVRLQLRLAADDFQSYRAILLNAEGATVSTTESLKPEPFDGGRIVVVSVPAQPIPSGEYQLRLDGIRADGESEIADNYRFTVVRR